MAAAWTGVGWIKFASASCFCSAGESSSSENCFKFFLCCGRRWRPPVDRSSGDCARRLQLHCSRQPLAAKAEGLEKVFHLYAGKPGRRAKHADSGFATHSASSAALRNGAAAWPGTASTSVGHYAEGSGKLWEAVLRMKARTAHDQTAERNLMVPHSGRSSGNRLRVVEGFAGELGADEVDPVPGF